MTKITLTTAISADDQKRNTKSNTERTTTSITQSSSEWSSRVTRNKENPYQQTQGQIAVTVNERNIRVVPTQCVWLGEKDNKIGPLHNVSFYFNFILVLFQFYIYFSFAILFPSQCKQHKNIRMVLRKFYLLFRYMYIKQCYMHALLCKSFENSLQVQT